VDGVGFSLAPSLAAVLSSSVDRLEPRVADFFDRMDGWALTASVRLHQRAGRWAAALGTILVGQGMYEEDLEEVDARFRLFRRDDGSLHFVREFWCADAIRVFDSDFVVREVDGRPTILEVFQDLGVAPERLVVTGTLDLEPSSALGRWWWHRAIGLPARIGEIRYTATPRPDAREGPAIDHDSVGVSWEAGPAGDRIPT
jgi:hypothetical protein